MRLEWCGQPSDLVRLGGRKEKTSLFLLYFLFFIILQRRLSSDRERQAPVRLFFRADLRRPEERNGLLDVRRSGPMTLGQGGESHGVWRTWT